MLYKSNSLAPREIIFEQNDKLVEEIRDRIWVLVFMAGLLHLLHPGSLPFSDFVVCLLFFSFLIFSIEFL